MIKYYKGSIFNVNVDAIVNPVNTKGFMGKGLALEFKIRFNDMFLDYKKKCLNNSFKIGKVGYYVDDNLIIINFPTKEDYKKPSKLTWIEAGMRNFIETYKKYNIKSVAFPKLGTGQGNLQWEEVYTVMKKYLQQADLIVYICLDELKYAEGKEKEMLDMFNEIDLDLLSERIGLKSNQLKNLENNRPFKRFWYIYKTKSIGEKTYFKIFHYFCKEFDYDENQQLEQQTLFD